MTQPQPVQDLVLRIGNRTTSATRRPSTLQLRQAFAIAWPNPTPHVLQAFQHFAERAEAGLDNDLDLAIRERIRCRLEPALAMIDLAEFLATAARTVFGLKPECSFCFDAPSTVVLLNRVDHDRFSAETACDTCMEVTKHWIAVPFEETSRDLHQGAARYHTKHTTCEICKAEPTAAVISRPEPAGNKISYVAHCSNCRRRAKKYLAAA